MRKQPNDKKLVLVVDHVKPMRDLKDHQLEAVVGGSNNGKGGAYYSNDR